MYVHTYNTHKLQNVHYILVLLTDGLLWECKLCGTIVPKECKLKPGAVRVEVKLKKQGLEAWSDFCDKNNSQVHT